LKEEEMKAMTPTLTATLLHHAWQGALCLALGLSWTGIHAQVLNTADQPAQTDAKNSPETAQVSIEKVAPTDEILINVVSLQRFRGFGLPVRSIIVAAYCPRLTQRDFMDAAMTMRIDDQALAADNSSFNVEATGPSWQATLQKALSQQLGIKVVRTTKLTPVYVLRVPPGGAKGLLSPGENAPDPSLAPSLKERQFDPDKFKDLPPELREKLKRKPKATGPQPWTKLDEAKGELDAVRSSMASLTMDLERVLQRPVLNETGLTGEYDVKLFWGAKGPRELLRLLHDQLGLQVEERDEPLEWLVAAKTDAMK
jgi:uncharacterized protein (TIGR03435 family)